MANSDLPEYEYESTPEEWEENIKHMESQIRLIKDQEKNDTPSKHLKIRCGCLKLVRWVYMYRCLYCGIFFCRECAQEHYQPASEDTAMAHTKRPRRTQTGERCPQHSGHEPQQGGSGLAHTKVNRRRKGKPEPSREQGRHDATECDGAVANPERQGPQGPGFENPNGGGELESRNGNGPILPLFAPGPTDHRWPGIIEQFPGLAPATESGLRMLVDESPLVVDESRAHQLRQIGNGVVPLQAAAALVVLIRRSGTQIAPCPPTP